MSDTAQELKRRILELTRQFSELTHSGNRPGYDPKHAPFVAGKTNILYAGRVFNEDEVEAAVSATLDFWLTLGKEGETFERKLASILGVRRSILVNSGSSANLLAVSALTSYRLGDRRLRPGDEVITVAAGFPTTVAPMIQNGLVPVFIDNDPVTLNARRGALEEAYRPGKTKAVMIGHTLSNPFDLTETLTFCHKYDLWLIEDNCDSLGSTYSMPLEQAKALGLDYLLKSATGPGPEPSSDRSAKVQDGTLTAPTGSWGDLSTQSFYPPHHITLGEGGTVNVIRNTLFKVILESFRDWGRDCYCASGVDNTCGKRFNYKLGELPEGYDHKFTYSHLGYNLKPLDIQAAIGLRQLEKLPAFLDARRQNWEYLRRGLADLEEFFEFHLPTHATAWTPDGFLWERPGGSTCNPAWFGFMVMVRPEAPFRKFAMARYLDDRKIGNRMLLGGNLTRQPAFVQLRNDNPAAFRVVGDLHGADKIMNGALFLGTHPGMTRPMLDYIIDQLHAYVKEQVQTVRSPADHNGSEKPLAPYFDEVARMPAVDASVDSETV
jgi:CDP-4-dehydro-6-deoxyglucose reductase, E1